MYMSQKHREQGQQWIRLRQRAGVEVERVHSRESMH